MLEELLGGELYADAIRLCPPQKICEIRLRAARKLAVKDAFSSFLSERTIAVEEISSVIKRATKNSLYAYQEELRKGYLPFKGGIRIGVAGEGVVERERLITYKNITSLCIRVPHEVYGSAKKISQLLNPFENLLIIAPPFGGKTTLLRDVARYLSLTSDVLALDERGEMNIPEAHFGERIDFISDTPKSLAAEGALRAMSPEVIVFDEIFPPKDGGILSEIARSGIKIAAGIHADSVENAVGRYPELNELFRSFVVLSNKPRAGSIKSVVRKR